MFIYRSKQESEELNLGTKSDQHTRCKPGIYCKF